MFNWLFRKKEQVVIPEQSKKRKSLFTTHEFDEYDPTPLKAKVSDLITDISRKQPAFNPQITGLAMDDSSNGYPSFKMYAAGYNNVSETIVYWYASQGFIGAQLCGIIAQNWLVNKACSMPGDDAIRKGYNIVSVDGDELDPKAVKIIKNYDRSMRLNFNMREFIRKGRIFGIRIAMFKVQSTDQDYYEKPFNIDGVTPGSYKGIVQIDPYWTAPMLDAASSSQPDTMYFYEPTWWLINGKKVHRSHLIIFKHAEPIDILKPQYLYGGIPLAQQIMERIYAAERVSNEAPQLAMSKRSTIWLTDMEAVMQDTNSAISRLQQWSQFRDNYGVKLGDKEGDEFAQFDTSLADFDNLIMTQYQLVAAIAGVPSTKLIGTQPKGFNSSGEYEEASYHELLESIQTHDLTPFAERHHALVIKSFVEPQLKIKMNLATTLNWLPLDSPTAEELAATNMSKAQTGQLLITSGAISSEEERQRIATDKTSGYNEIGIMENDAPDSLENNDFTDFKEIPNETQDNDPCWEGYEQFGMKDKNGKQVPNCVSEDNLQSEMAQDADEHWITINGTHILVNGKGDVIKGPDVIHGSGEKSDKAYTLNAKGKKAEAFHAHNEAAEAYQAEGNTELAQRHRDTAQSLATSLKEKTTGKETKSKSNSEKSDHNSGEKSDKAYALNFKGQKAEAIKAHNEAAEAYEAEGNPDLAKRHKDIAKALTESLKENKTAEK